MFVLAALAVMGWWAPFGWWRVPAMSGAVISFILMAGFFGTTKLLPMALDIVVMWAAVTDWLSAPATGGKRRCCQSAVSTSIREGLHCRLRPGCYVGAPLLLVRAFYAGDPVGDTVRGAA
jgi:hypothetical protein